MKDDLGEAHEASVSMVERHQRGQYFTPFPLIELVLDLCGQARIRSIVDPACGSGRFLMASRARWPSAQLLGWDSDPLAFDLAEQNLPRARLTRGSFLDARGSRDADLLVGNPPYIRRRGQKRDLYVDFLEAAPSWLRDGGRVALVLSSSWLDVEYGRVVREILLRDFAVEWIVESSAERWFPGAKVNTMILVARRETDPEVRATQSVRFAELRDLLPAEPVLIREVRQDKLAPLAPWGPQLRAPGWWLERWSAMTAASAASPAGESGAIVPLETLAEVKRGWTTNANAFFYPGQGSSIEERWLRPLLKSPKRVHGVRGHAADLPDQAFVCDATRAELERLDARGALAWVDSSMRPSWSLQPQVPVRQVLMKGYGNRFRQPLFDEPVHYDQQLYGLYPRTGVPLEALAAVLNSSWFGLGLELLGRVNFGDGVLWLGLRDARRLPVPDLRTASDQTLRRLIDGFAALPDETVPPVGSLAESTRWGEAVARIDRVVAGLLGIEERDVLSAFAGLCARRARKAGSVKRSSRVESARVPS